MIEEKPFNPLPLPDDLQLATVAEALTKPAARMQRRTRKAKPLEVVRTRKLTLAQIKARLQSKLAKLDPPRLKRLLRTCGLGFAVVASVALLAKYAPIVLVLIATLGVVGLASLYHRLSPVFKW